MLGPDRMARFTAGAVVPEQVVPYVTAVSGMRPEPEGECIGFSSGGAFVLAGYPLHDPLDRDAMEESVSRVLMKKGVTRITVISPYRPAAAPAHAASTEDRYFELRVPHPEPGQKLRNLLRRAEREVSIDRGGTCGPEHMDLVERFLSLRDVQAGTRRIFMNIPVYTRTSSGSLVLTARTGNGRIAAFSVGEFSSLTTAFYLFSFRDPEAAPPGCADLLLSGLLSEAAQRGQGRMNLGLGINAGVRFFKKKWEAEPFLPCVETVWEP